MIPFDLSTNLEHTWLIDLDGTILKHNGWKDKEELLPGVFELWNMIPAADTIIILSARNIRYKKKTLNFLNDNKLRYNFAIFGLPTGERILINDIKPNNTLKTAIAWNVERDKGF
jgi:hypothetical protein